MNRRDFFRAVLGTGLASVVGAPAQAEAFAAVSGIDGGAYVPTSPIAIDYTGLQVETAVVADYDREWLDVTWSGIRFAPGRIGGA